MRGGLRVVGLRVPLSEFIPQQRKEQKTRDTKSAARPANGERPPGRGFVGRAHREAGSSEEIMSLQVLDG